MSEEVKSFYDDIVKHFKKQVNIMGLNLNASNLKGDFHRSIDIIKSLRETLNLISIYDWQLHYSEYGTEINGEMIQQVSVWEQNHDRQIKNHKVWNTDKKYILESENPRKWISINK